MTDNNEKAILFLEYKSLLFSVAYNMLGQVDTAEDIVQDTFVKWLEANATEVRHTKAYLVKAVTNRCINYLHSARVKRETYVGMWLPEPLVQPGDRHPHTQIEYYHALSIGILVLLEKLTPVERGVFLLKEIFAYDYTELAEIFDKTADNCRQILKRAKDNLGKDAVRFEADLKVHEQLLHQFLQALTEGSMQDLIQVLKEDIMLIADGNGSSFDVNGQRLGAPLKPIYGRENVGRLLLRVIPKLEQVPDFHREIILVNGLPTIIDYSGNFPVGMVSIEPEGSNIKNIYVQANPEKLKRFQKNK